jgi:hypothetical protein
MQNTALTSRPSLVSLNYTSAVLAGEGFWHETSSDSIRYDGAKGHSGLHRTCILLPTSAPALSWPHDTKLLELTAGRKRPPRMTTLPTAAWKWK